MTTPKPRRRWLKYALLTLLGVIVTICTIPCIWFAVRNQQGKREREVAAAIEEMGGRVMWTFHPSYVVWFLFGYCPDNTIRVVGLSSTTVTDADLEQVKALRQVEQLELNNTKITDAGLEQIQGLNQLCFLYLENTQVTDAGLEHFKGLTHLLLLDLEGTQVTDVGLESLTGLTDLYNLRLAGTKVTDDGVKKLQQALPNCYMIR